MKDLLIEAGIMGFLTMILGSVIFKIFLDKYNKELIVKNKDKKINYFICMSFFVTGIVLFMII